MKKYAAMLGEDVRLIARLWKALRNPHPRYHEPYLLSVQDSTTVGLTFKMPVTDYKKVIGASRWHELARY